MISGEMLFELEGQAPRILRAGDAFWGRGGDVIHYRDANNRTDIPCSFVLMMLREPGKPMLKPVADGELEVRKDLRIRRTGETTASHHSDNALTHQWRQATRELVLIGAAAVTEADRPQSNGSISITLTSKALENDLLLADTGQIALSSLGDRVSARSHPMSVVPVRLDMLSELPSIRVLGYGMTEPTELRLTIELTAHNPHTDTTGVMTCECASVLLDPQMPVALLDFRLPQ